MEKSLFELYRTMFRIGCITYGGGWSILAQMEEEFSEKRGWVTREELLDFMSLARSFPGIMVINLSVLFGYRTRGAAGAAAAAFLLCIFTGINKLAMVIAAAALGLFMWGRSYDDTP